MTCLPWPAKARGAIAIQITTQIGRKFKGIDATFLGIFLYVVLLFITGAIFWAAIPPEEALTGGHRMTIVGALGVAYPIIILSLCVPVWECAARNQLKVLVGLAAMVVAALAAGFWWWQP
jgi:hypothetical protein